MIGARWITHVFAALVAVLGFGSGPALAQGIISEWDTVKAPPPPALKPVEVAPKTTALLMLDFLNQNCAPRPRCAASIPKVEKLAAGARAKGVTVIYSVFPGAKEGDIVKDLTPKSGEPVITAPADKFVRSDLEKMLKDKGIATVIVVGTAANGAVLYTASQAALRGFKVIVPVEGMSSEKFYAEQYTAWDLVNAPTIAQNVTLTSLDTITY